MSSLTIKVSDSKGNWKETVDNCAKIAVDYSDKIGTILIDDILRIKVPVKKLTLEAKAKSGTFSLKVKAGVLHVLNDQGGTVATLEAELIYIVPDETKRTANIYV